MNNIKIGQTVAKAIEHLDGKLELTGAADGFVARLMWQWHGQQAENRGNGGTIAEAMDELECEVRGCLG